MKTLQARLEQRKEELLSLWESLYHDNAIEPLYHLLEKTHAKRSKELLLLDAQREQNPTWYLSSDMTGEMLYTDKFNKTFAGLEEKLPYLLQRKVKYLHLMPCLKMPPDPNDGGYAVEDFTQFDAQLGTTEDFISLAKACRNHQISLCLDFVLNHSSDTHRWALQAKAGDEKFKKRYFFIKEKALVDAYEATTPEVFPQQAPGNFTYLPELDEYVLTTFNHFQWDLNYANSEVLLAMIESVLTLANYGVEVFRFDAIPYIWKQWGTSNRNLPEVHSLIRIFRLVLEIVAPLCIIKGEVVMAPKEVAPYFGTENRPECHLLYNVSLMVQMWNTLATRDTRLLEKNLSELPTEIPSTACWVNYLRCHDDIGWGIEDEELQNLGFSPFDHKQFLISFYLGTFPGSFAKGELYEYNEKTLDARNCGTTSSLCGLERALENHDVYQWELSLKRIVLAHVFIYLSKGLCILYSGDELATLNDYHYKQNPHLAKDSRNMHRPNFDWEKTKEPTPESTYVSMHLNSVIGYRSTQKDFRSDSSQRVISASDSAVLALKRGADHLVLANFSEYQKEVRFDYPAFGFYNEVFSDREVVLNTSSFIIGPYQYLVLKRM